MATFTSKLTETITLDSGTVNSENTRTITGIGEISKRILTITTNEATIATFSGAVASSGHYNDGAVRYIRFTNLDGTNFVTLTFTNGAGDEAAIKLDAGQSFVFNGDNSTGMELIFNATQNADAASDTALSPLTSVQADANTGNCDIEMLIAST